MVNVDNTLKESYTFVLKNTDPCKHISVKIFSHDELSNRELSRLNKLMLDEAKELAKSKGWKLIALREEK